MLPKEEKRTNCTQLFKAAYENRYTWESDFLGYEGVCSWTNGDREIKGTFALRKDLKATREQRIKRIEDGKSSWIGLIRMLEDEEIREKEGREMEIMAMAVDKNRKLISEYHNYADDTVDSPLLTPETVLEKDKE